MESNPRCKGQTVATRVERCTDAEPAGAIIAASAVATRPIHCCTHDLHTKTRTHRETMVCTREKLSRGKGKAQSHFYLYDEELVGVTHKLGEHVALPRGHVVPLQIVPPSVGTVWQKSNTKATNSNKQQQRRQQQQRVGHMWGAHACVVSS